MVQTPSAQEQQTSPEHASARNALPHLATSPDLHSQAYHQKLSRLRLVSLLSLFALILLCIVWEVWLYPTGTGTLVFKALPLCFAILGIVRHRMYTYRWLSLLLWLYVLEGGIRVYTDSPREMGLALAEIVLSIVLFVFCVFYIRQRLGYSDTHTKEADV